MTTRCRRLPLEDLDRQAETRPQQAAIATVEEEWSYARLREEARRMAARLASAGVSSGDRVSLHGGNSLPLVAAYYACFRLSAIACPLNTRWTSDELAPVLRRLRPVVHLADDELAPVADGVPHFDRQAVRILNLGGLAGQDEWPNQSSNSHAPRESGRAAHPDPDAPAVLLGTSGTSGQTKLVVHTARTLSHGVHMIASDLRPPERLAVCPLPLVHAGGLANLLCYVHLGSPLLLLKSPSAEEVLDIAQSRGASYINTLPALLQSLVAAQEADQRDLSGLERYVVSGAALPSSEQRRAELVLGVEVRQVWGATEAIGSFTYGRKAGPVSRPAPGAEVRLLDPEGNEVADGTAGEMLVRGDNVSPGYWESPDRVRALSEDGWFRSGDPFRREGETDYVFVGRAKDLIVRAGFNISPVEVEAVLERHPAVRAALVVGVPDPVLGQSVAALVQLSTGDAAGGADADAEHARIQAQLQRFAARRLAAYKIPVRIQVVEALPRTPATTKVDRKGAVALLLNEPARQ